MLLLWQNKEKERYSKITLFIEIPENVFDGQEV